MIVSRAMSRAVAAIALPLALTLAAAAPEPSPSALPDVVYALAGTWTCDASDGSRAITAVGTRNGDTVDVMKTVRPQSGAAYTTRDHYAYDAAKSLWSIDIDAGSPSAIHAIAPAWTAPNRTWSAFARGADGVVQRIRYEVLSADTLARTVLREEPTASGHWVAHGTELCARGDTPPKRSTCAVPNVAARTLVAVAPSMRDVPRGVSGTVQVLVSLDEESRIVSLAIVSSPSAALNRVALDAVRASKFQTEVRDCRPIAAKYVYTIDFGR